MVYSSPDEMPFVCRFCLGAFSKQRSLAQHLFKIHQWRKRSRRSSNENGQDNEILVKMDMKPNSDKEIRS